MARTAASSVAAAVAGSSISPAHLASRPMVPTRSTSWNASRPRTLRSTWPTSTNIGVESAVAVWMPMARLAAPTARVPRQAAGRPVSCPYASAANAAPPSWRVATTRMPAAWSASRTGRKLSPGTVNAIRTPAARRVAAMSSATVDGRAGSAAASAADPASSDGASSSARSSSGASATASTASTASEVSMASTVVDGVGRARRRVVGARGLAVDRDGLDDGRVHDGDGLGPEEALGRCEIAGVDRLDLGDGDPSLTGDASLTGGSAASAASMASGSSGWSRWGCIATSCGPAWAAVRPWPGRAGWVADRPTGAVAGISATSIPATTTTATMIIKSLVVRPDPGIVRAYR